MVEDVWVCVLIGKNCLGVVYMMVCNIGMDLVILFSFEIFLVMMLDIYWIIIDVNGVSLMVLVGEIIIVLGEILFLESGGLYVMLM